MLLRKPGGNKNLGNLDVDGRRLQLNKLINSRKAQRFRRLPPFSFWWWTNAHCTEILLIAHEGSVSGVQIHDTHHGEW